MGYACESPPPSARKTTRILIVFPACFLGALQFVAGAAGKREAAAKAKIHSSVVLGPAAEMGGFALKVDLKVEGIEDEALIKAAHEVPFS
jgi:organic hydroperoxide reductase OsmC/OhrA